MHPLRRISRAFGFNVTRIPKVGDDGIAEEIVPMATYAPWNRDAEFRAVYDVIRDSTFLDKYHCWCLWQLVEQVSKLEGSLLEVGVWRGGSGALMAYRARQCGIRDTVYLCDTFRGMVKGTAEETAFPEGVLAMSRQGVDALVDKYKLENVEVLQGIFPDETGSRVTADKIRLCHIDVDVYQSARDILDWVWSRLVIGGIVLYDDYTSPLTMGVIRHVEEERMNPDRIFIHNLSGQAIFIKLK